LRAFVQANAEALGLGPRQPFDVLPLEVSRIARADDTLSVTLSTQVVARSGVGGVSLLFDATGRLRYAIPGVT
jgi:hypothetical protein